MKRFLLTSFKVIVGLVAVLGVGFYAVANYSEIKQELTCDGRWQRGAEHQSEVAHIVLTEYRWWVHLWSNSDGNAKVQTEKLALAYYIPFVSKIGEDSLALFFFNEDERGKMVGGFQVANGEITIKFLEDLVFVGTCRQR